MKQVELVRATEKDIDELHQMQTEAFMPLYEIYHDDLSPVNEPKDRTLWKIRESHFYFIVYEGRKVGALRAVRDRSIDDDSIMWISPIFILPKFQDLGVGSSSILKLFEIWDKTHVWKLATIKEEGRNCHVYEKLGFKRFGEATRVNDLMTLVNYERKTE